MTVPLSPESEAQIRRSIEAGPIPTLTPSFGMFSACWMKRSIDGNGSARSFNPPSSKPNAAN